jgi:integrase
VCEYRKGRNPYRPNSRSQTFATKREAEELDRGLDDRRTTKDTSTPTFEELAREYSVAKFAKMSSSDQDNNYYKLTGIILPRFGHVIATKITHSELDSYVKGRLSDHVYVYMGPRLPRKKTDRFVTLPTIHRELSIIRAILNWAVKAKRISGSEMDGYEMPPKRGKIVLPPTQDDYEKILAHAAPHCQRFIMLSYYTGLRPGRVEAFGLTWDNVDFDAEIIQIISAEKGGAPLRAVSLHPKLLAEMIKWKAEDESEGYHNGYIIHYKHKQITTSMKRAWAGAKRRAGITRPLRPYSLRHKTATDLINSGAGSVKDAAEILGNDPKTLMEYYQMVDSATKRGMVKGLK